MKAEETSELLNIYGKNYTVIFSRGAILQTRHSRNRQLSKSEYIV